MTLQDLMGGLDGLREDFREDMALLRGEMNHRHDKSDTSLDALNEKVRIQNGRIYKLEARQNAGETATGWKWMIKQPWFPWLIVFLVTEVGPKAAPSIITAIVSALSRVH